MWQEIIVGLIGIAVVFYVGRKIYKGIKGPSNHNNNCCNCSGCALKNKK